MVGEGPRPASGLPLTLADVQEFQALVKRECGVEMGEADSWVRIGELLALYRTLLGPTPDDPAVRAGSNIVHH